MNYETTTQFNKAKRMADLGAKEHGIRFAVLKSGATYMVASEHDSLVSWAMSINSDRIVYLAEPNKFDARKFAEDVLWASETGRDDDELALIRFRSALEIISGRRNS